MTGAEMIAAERQRQLDEERWTPEYDDEHDDGSLAVVAAGLAVYGTDATVDDPSVDGPDPWRLEAKHGSDRIRQLTIAGALIAAEIDRIQRARERGAA